MAGYKGAFDGLCDIVESGVGQVADIDEDAQLNSLTPLSFDDEEAEDDAGKPAETDKDKEK